MTTWVNGTDNFEPEETKNDWKTPPSVWRPFKRALNGFDLDPCTDSDGDDIAKTKFTERGKKREWYGDVWLNPPFSECGSWMDKAIKSTSSGNAKCVVTLVPVRADTKWFHRSLDNASRLCLRQGRINFYNGDGKVSGAPMDIAHFVFGESTDNLDDYLSSIGWAVNPKKGIEKHTQTHFR